jgi:hypothetical protein
MMNVIQFASQRAPVNSRSASVHLQPNVSAPTFGLIRGCILNDNPDLAVCVCGIVDGLDLQAGGLRVVLRYDAD